MGLAIASRGVVLTRRTVGLRAPSPHNSREPVPIHTLVSKQAQPLIRRPRPWRLRRLRGQLCTPRGRYATEQGRRPYALA